jgi:hypothetical protein
MHELLGIVLGLALGTGVAAIRPRRLRAAALLPALAASGVLASAVNGELGGDLAGLFVAVDTLFAALGVAVGTALYRLAGSNARRSSVAPASSRFMSRR